MKAEARPVRMLVGSVALCVVMIVIALGIKRLRSDETAGLKYIGPVPTATPSPAPPVGSSESEFSAHWFADSLALLGEPPINKLVSSPDAEAYRFYYEPSFEPWVCVTAWREGDRYQVRTVVLYGRSAPVLAGKTETISARKWNRLRAAFTKHSVTDPLDGTNPYQGLDGSSWFMESFVSGRATLVRISNPVRTIGPPHFQIVKSRDPRLDEFVKTSLLFLDWADVRVPRMY
jgi:hypothetical protein